MMSKPNGAPHTALIDTTRALLRGMLRRCVGDGGLMAAHGFYHTVLRRAGRFDPPESPATLWLLAGLTARAGSVLDVGANVGRYSWFFIRHRRVGAPLFAFEPNPAPMALLSRLLRGQPETHRLAVALGDADGSVKLTVPIDRFGNAISGLDWVYPADDKGGAIPVHRLDSLVRAGAVRLADPVLMKIDVEGYEPAVLAGAGRTLERHRPVVDFECDPATLMRAALPSDAVFVRLAALGCSILTEEDGRFILRETPASISRNYVAIPVSPTQTGAALTAAEVMTLTDAVFAADSGRRRGTIP